MVVAAGCHPLTIVGVEENASYRAHVAREIEQTEEDYVKNLDILLEVPHQLLSGSAFGAECEPLFVAVLQQFLIPLRARMLEKQEEHDMTCFNSLFSDVQVIRNYNG